MGLDLLALAFLALGGAGSLASVFAWLVVSERKKAHFIDELGRTRDVVVLGHESGDIAKPLTIDVVVHGARLCCVAVVRGEKRLWQVELREVTPLPGPVVLVDRAFRGWSRAARGLPALASAGLGARFLVVTEHGPFIERLLDRPGARFDMSSLLQGPGVPIEVVFEATRVMVEVPRARELDVDELVRAATRARALHALVAGREAIPLPPPPAVAPRPGVEAPSSNPVAVPLLAASWKI